MSRFFFSTALLCLITSFSPLVGQSCSLPSGAGCSAGPDITGDLFIESGNTVVLPGTYNGVFYSGFSGTVNITLANNSQLTLGDDFMIAPGTIVNIVEDNGNPVVLAGGIEYRKNTTPEDFVQLSELLSGCEDPNGCTVGGILPVELVAWEVKPGVDKGDVMLVWSSASESGNDYFFVEHGTDGINFREIARIDGRGNERGGADYTYEHNTLPGGTHFYRLGQRDLDGATARFNVLSITIAGNNALGVYPNPSGNNEVIRVRNLTEGVLLELLSADGRRIASWPTAANGSLTEVRLPAGVAPGLYLLRSGQDVVRLAVRK